MTIKKTTNHISKKNTKSLMYMIIFLCIALVGFIVSSVLMLYSNNCSDVKNLSNTLMAAEVQELNAELAVFIFLIIFASLVVISIITIVVWILVLKFKVKSKVKVQLPSQELNSPEEVTDMEDIDA